MSEYITLMGAEQVQNAASMMVRAAEQMARAASNMDDALERHRRLMDDWLGRFAEIVTAEIARKS